MQVLLTYEAPPATTSEGAVDDSTFVCTARTPAFVLHRNSTGGRHQTPAALVAHEPARREIACYVLESSPSSPILAYPVNRTRRSVLFHRMDAGMWLHSSKAPNASQRSGSHETSS